MRVMAGKAWEQKIAEDNWPVVTTSKCQPTQRNLSILETNISKQTGNLLLPSFLTCISIYSFISKAIKLLFVLLVPLTII